MAGRGASKAAVNLVRLYRAVETAEAPTEEELGAHARGRGDGEKENGPLPHGAHCCCRLHSPGELYWRRLAAYAERMRDLMEEIRVNGSGAGPAVECGSHASSPSRAGWGGASPSTASGIPEAGLHDYERMLAVASAKAEAARRQWEAPPPEGPLVSSPPRGGGGTGAPPSRALAGSAEVLPPAGDSPPHSPADRRALLLGDSAGRRAARQLQVGRGGGEQLLADDRRVQDRLESELSGMARVLKGNVEAMHGALVADNSTLDQIDSDVAKGQHRLAKVSNRVDEQRRANRATTCVQCASVLLVASLFFGTFLLMQVFGKAKVHTAPVLPTPSIAPPGGERLAGPVRVRIQSKAVGAKIVYTLDGSDPRTSQQTMRYDRDIVIGEKMDSHKDGRVTVNAVVQKPQMQDSQVASAVFSFQPSSNAGDETKAPEGTIDKEETRRRRIEGAKSKGEEIRTRAEESRERKESDRKKRREEWQKGEDEARKSIEAETKQKESERRGIEEEVRRKADEEKRLREMERKRLEDEARAQAEREAQRKDLEKKRIDREVAERVEEERKQKREEAEAKAREEREREEAEARARAEKEREEAEAKAREEREREEANVREIAAAKQAEEDRAAAAQRAEERRIAQEEEQRKKRVEEKTVAENIQWSAGAKNDTVEHYSRAEARKRIADRRRREEQARMERGGEL